MLTTTRRRHAFTLIELVVVVSIIAVLVALTATAAFGVRRNMQKQNAETTLQKLDQALLQRQKAIRDQIQDDIKNNRAEGPTMVAAYGGNKDTAQAVMLYARLKQQMPMTFSEAKNGFTVNGYSYPPSPAFAALPATPVGTPGNVEQSAACLHAIVSAMGPLDGLEQQVGTSTNGYKVFVDGIGSHIGYVRLAYDGNLAELNNRPLALNPAVDPFDPSNKASAALTPLWGTLNCPTLTDGGTYPTSGTYRGTGNNRYHTTAVFSAGLNRAFADPGLYDGDNLLSYRLRKEGGSGE